MMKHLSSQNFVSWIKHVGSFVNWNHDGFFVKAQPKNNNRELCIQAAGDLFGNASFPHLNATATADVVAITMAKSENYFNFRDFIWREIKREEKKTIRMWVLKNEMRFTFVWAMNFSIVLGIHKLR